MPTYRLETFGKLTLSGSSAGLSHQRRRLALLAVLAAAGNRGVSRDSLLACLWSESTAGNARHSLEQLLHALRRALGDSIFSGTNPVGLNSDIIASDVAEFERALERGALAEAAALYAGPFLNGFYLDDAPEFERWTTAERSRLATLYAEAINKLAGEAEKAGDHAATVRWRRLLVETDPVSSRSALALMRALVAAGDRTAALQHARIYEVLVRQELESEPDPSIAKYVAMLRAGGDDRPSVTVQTPPATISPASELSIAAKPVAATTIYKESPVVRSPTRRRDYRWPAGIFFAATVLLVAAFAFKRRADVPGVDQNKIVVVPFRTSGADSSVKYLGEGVVDLIVPMLTGEGGPAAVDSRTAISTWNRITRGRDGTAEDARQVARELGAGTALTGSVVEVGGRLTITGSVIPIAAGDARPLTSISAPLDSIDKLLDEFVRQILARQSGVAESSLSTTTSQSLAAIRAYLSGRAAYRRGDEDQAIESFSRALDIDSTFALAALDLVVATGRLMRTELCLSRTCRVYSMVPGFVLSERVDDLFNRAVRAAWGNRLKLGKRDRPLLDALRGDNYPRPSSARETMANLGRAVRAAPDRPEAHHLLGVLLLYQGQALGMSDWRERATAAFRTASNLDPNYLAPLAGLVDVAAFGHDTASLLRAGTVYLSRDSTSATADYVRWIVAAGGSDIGAQRTIRARLSSLKRGTLDHIFLTSQMSGVGLDDADSVMTILIEGTADPIDKSVALRRGSLLALNRGRPLEASRLLRRVGEMRKQDYSFQNFTMEAAMFNDGERVVAESSARQMARGLARDTIKPLSPEARRPTNVAMLSQAMWYLDRGDTAGAAPAVDWLRRHVEGPPRTNVFMVVPVMLMTSLAQTSDAAAQRALVDSLALAGCCALPPWVNFSLAHAYESSGDEASALRAIRRGVWFNPPRMMSTQLREEGRLAARLGDRAGAIRAYEHYLALRSDPEPALIPDRDSIRAEVDRLKRRR